MGDSYLDHNSGMSIDFDGLTNYLELENHKEEIFNLTEGTISVWVKPTGSLINNTVYPILSMATNYERNASSGEVSLVGTMFSFELNNGLARIAGFSTRAEFRK